MLFAQHRLRAIDVNTVRIMLVQRHHDSNENRGCSQRRICLGYFLALGENQEAANSGRPLSLFAYSLSEETGQPQS